MIISKFLSVFTILVLPLFHQQPLPNNDFAFIKRQNSISLSERWIEQPEEQIRELKAEFTIKSIAAEELVLLLQDEAKGLIWSNNARVYKVMPGKNSDCWRTYLQYQAPWPVNNYDCLLEYRLKTSGKTAEVLFKSIVSNQYPPSEKITRITGTQGKWLLEEQGKNLKVTYLISSDRNKTIPRWISDPIVHENLFKTMSKLKNLVEKSNSKS